MQADLSCCSLRKSCDFVVSQHGRRIVFFDHRVPSFELGHAAAGAQILCRQGQIVGDLDDGGPLHNSSGVL